MYCHGYRGLTSRYQSIAGRLYPQGNTILFGLSAIRNLGLGAIEAILHGRETDGTFTSLAELCDRIDLHTVNRRALEALILSGALDGLNPNRHQLMLDLPLIVEWCQGRAKDREVGQGNLFDMMVTATSGSSGEATKRLPRQVQCQTLNPRRNCARKRSYWASISLTIPSKQYNVPPGY
ncbi:MAG: hypothetical protein LVS60_06355 [Nodosilinea sp. LVE1205-7]